MWILPKQLHTSPYVPDTAALISDSDEFSRLCEQSLTQRGKDSAARTWSAKLKRDSWMQLLFGRTLKPSRGPSFATAWTSCLGATHASRSQPLASASVPKTQDTSGRTYQPELLQCDRQYVSLKTSRDISRWGCPTLSKTWQDWVTERRGAYSARVKLALRTSGSVSSSWLTISTEDACRSGSAEGWKEYEDGNRTTQARLRNQIHNWATPAARDTQGQRGAAANARKGNPLDTLPNQMAVHGQADPASSRSHGSRQGSSWATPRGYAQAGPDPNRVNRPTSGGDDLVTQIAKVQRNMTAKLNPRWVETLMGLPIGWTMPSCTSPQTIEPMSCDSSAMESCQPPQSEPLELFFQS
jgi:hypothetical protein